MLVDDVHDPTVININEKKERIPINFIFKAKSDKVTYTLEFKSDKKEDLSSFAKY